MAPAFVRDEPEWLGVGSPDSFQEGVPKSVNLTMARRDGWIETTEVKGLWVVRQTGNQFTAYNGRCTHLRVLAGPPPRPLDTLPVRVDNGSVQVQYQDYRLGTPDKASA